MIAETLAAALERAELALEGDDAVAAAAELEQAVRGCAALAERGVQLDDATLERLRLLHVRGTSAAARAAARLARALDNAGSARRAAAAYSR
jgi:hypothetical protein